MDQPSLKFSDRKRQAIVEAAVAQFREHGFGGTSMDGIAAAAGVSKRTIYNHFPSKDELFAAILEQLWQRSLALGETPYDPARPLRAQLQALLGAKLDLLEDASFLDLARVAIAEMMHTPERAAAVVARLGEKEEGLAGWIRAAQADGRLRAADPVYAAHQLQGLLKAFAFWPQLAMGAAPLTADERRRVLDDSVDMFLGFYTSETARAR